MNQREILENICSHYDVSSAELIQKAFLIAERELSELKRSDGMPFIEHPLGVAQIVSNEIGLMADAVIAVFLHEASRVNPSIVDTLKKDFPSDTIGIATTLNKISVIKPKDTNLEADRYRRLIVSYSTDPRVFLIKLADRLELMRNLGKLPKADAIRKNAETMFLYIPLAHQTGVYNIKAEMENLWLKYAHPEQYREITNNLKATEKDREVLVSDFVIPLKDRLTKEGIKYTLKVRTKSAYSIWKKMQAQNIPFNQVYDVFAIRFIIDAPLELEKDVCWQVYSLVTEEYEPDTKRLRDWLTVPKSNGYQSLHTTVKNKKGNYIEVQIRTERMDYEAEIGLAAHWSYKGVKRESSMNSWLERVRNMMENPSDTDYVYSDESVNQDVFVYTPNGDLRQLKAGATVLDFAFDIHTNVGLKCAGGKIGGKMVSIKDKLKTGDVVEILTNKNQKPSADWLEFVVTSKAKTKIKQKINEVSNKLAKEGKEVLDRKLKNWKITPLNDELLSAIVKKYKIKIISEFYSLVGAGEIDLLELKAFLENYSADVEESLSTTKVTQSASSTLSHNNSEYLVIGSNEKLKGLDYKMAKCCNPVYGDEVFGFVTINDGIKIHRMSCPNASRLLTYEHRIQKVRWKENVNLASFQTGLKIILEDESVAGKVFSLIVGYNASIRSYELHKRASKGDFEVLITLYVKNNTSLDAVMAELRRMREIKQVTRI